MENLLALALTILVAAGALYLRSPGFKGRLGESRVSAYLAGRLPPGRYTILTDLTLPTQAGTTQIDHIVVGPAGIFVIETKNMSGWIFGGPDQPEWTQVVFRRKSRFQNPSRQNHLHLKVVQRLLQVKWEHLHGLVVFAGSASPKTPMPDDVVFHLRALGDRISAVSGDVFNAQDRAALCEKLTRAALARDKATRSRHIAHVRANLTRRKTKASSCPKCGSPMQRRVQRNTGQAFLGCNRYPACTGIRPLPPGSET